MTFEEIKAELCRLIGVSYKSQVELILQCARSIVGEGYRYDKARGIPRPAPTDAHSRTRGIH